MPKAKPVSDAPTWAAKLNRRERRFVEEYVIDLNASAALRRSGCYSTKNPDVDAHVILRRPKVAEAVATLVAERSGATQSRVIEELGKIAFADVHDISFVKGGVVQVEDTADLTADQRAVVAAYETNEKGNVTVKLYDKVRALDLLAKILGMRRSPTSEAPAVAVQVNVNTADAGSRVLERLDATVARRPALSAPTEEPMQLISAPIKETIDVES
jgi:phage terminase small subunit